MPSTTRKLSGTVLLVLLLVVYALAAMVVGTIVLPNAGRFAEFLYYAVAGLAWVPLAGLVISWMHRS